MNQCSKCRTVLTLSEDTCKCGGAVNQLLVKVHPDAYKKGDNGADRRSGVQGGSSAW